jgi:hypothetical protein
MVHLFFYFYSTTNDYLHWQATTTTARLIYTRNHDVLSKNLQTISDPSFFSSISFADGSRLPLSTKEIGSAEFSASLLHSPNSRFVTVIGDGEYIIYTCLAWRNKSFGNGISFAWAPFSNTYTSGRPLSLSNPRLFLRHLHDDILLRLVLLLLHYYIK